MTFAIYPFDKAKDAYILEFKVLNEHREKTVQETAENALKTDPDQKL